MELRTAVRKVPREVLEEAVIRISRRGGLTLRDCLSMHRHQWVGADPGNASAPSQLVSASAPGQPVDASDPSQPVQQNTQDAGSFGSQPAGAALAPSQLEMPVEQAEEKKVYAQAIVADSLANITSS